MYRYLMLGAVLSHKFPERSEKTGAYASKALTQRKNTI